MAGKQWDAIVIGAGPAGAGHRCVEDKLRLHEQNAENLQFKVVGHQL